ncbi:MAG: hypothetical protein DSY85_13395 [Marinomonas sp.]|nr:MAG: hypothetical protein DSY85_13395 [Marinomonas sp.]
MNEVCKALLEKHHKIGKVQLLNSDLSSAASQAGFGCLNRRVYQTCWFYMPMAPKGVIGYLSKLLSVSLATSYVCDYIQCFKS